MQFNLRDSSPEDQGRVRHDVSVRRIGSAVPGLPMDSQPTDIQLRVVETSPSQLLTAPSQPQAREEDLDGYFDDSLDEAKDELYVSLPASVVGLQYYKGTVFCFFNDFFHHQLCIGMVGPDEEVTLVRELRNKYDTNAIQVLNISGTQVGHIPRNISSRLAPLIDRNLVTVEGDQFLVKW